MSRKKHDTTEETINYRSSTLFDAAERKRAVGIAEHGPVYTGDPVCDALAEVCDALNYIEMAERLGHDSAQIDAIRSVFIDAGTKLRELPTITGTVRTDW